MTRLALSCGTRVPLAADKLPVLRDPCPTSAIRFSFPLVWIALSPRSDARFAPALVREPERLRDLPVRHPAGVIHQASPGVALCHLQVLPELGERFPACGMRLHCVTSLLSAAGYPDAVRSLTL